MRVFDTGWNNHEFNTLALDPGGRWLAASGPSDSVVWDMTTDAPPTSVPSTPQFRFLPDGRVVYPYGPDLVAFAPATRRRAAIWTGGRYGTQFAVDPAGAWMVACRTLEDYTARLVAVERPGRPDQRELWAAGMGDEAGELGASEGVECLGDGERFLSAGNIAGANSHTKYYRVAIRSRADGRLLADAKRVFGYGDKVFASPASAFFVVLTAARMRVHRVDDLPARTRSRTTGGSTSPRSRSTRPGTTCWRPATTRR